MAAFFLDSSTWCLTWSANGFHSNHISPHSLWKWCLTWVVVGFHISSLPHCWPFSMLLSPSNILRDLISNDAGRDSPNTANSYQLERLKMDPFTSHINTLGIPYFWVQWICGMNYMPNQNLSNNSTVPDASLSVKHFQNVVRMIKSRMRSRLSLHQQVNSLGIFYGSVFIYFLYEVK